MSRKKKQGFASLSKQEHRAVSSEGGKWKGKKGFATLTPQQRKENASLAAKARWAEVRKQRALKELEKKYEQSEPQPTSED